MYRDRDRELLLLEKELLKKPPAEKAKAPSKQNAAPEAGAVPASQSSPVVYKNYANGYGKDLRNYASGYQAYNEKPRQAPVKQRREDNWDLKLIAGLLTAAIICVLLYWLANFVIL